MDEATQEVIDQIGKVLKSGACNMLDIRCVQRQADAMGLYDLVVFCQDFIVDRTNRSTRWIDAITKAAER